MPVDFRTEVAKYYDCSPMQPDDAEFYQSRLPSPDSTVLELGCGTGRVLVPLMEHCSYIHGIDISEAMLALCRKKLQALSVSKKRAIVQSGDITDLNLGRSFDFITAPFRVFQNLETDEEVEGLFQTVRTHLAPGGTCILNVFRPFLDKEAMATQWVSKKEIPSWEAPIEGGRVTCHDRRKRIDPEKQVAYTDLVYRRYRGEKLEDEAVLNLLMRYYYANEFVEMIESHGFQIVDRWGGYAGEAYGEGPELVVQFCKE
jgi:ubiquinone/menaquinone biosynthesis C-methylase UbiE